MNVFVTPEYQSVLDTVDKALTSCDQLSPVTLEAAFEACVEQALANGIPEGVVLAWVEKALR